MSQQSIQPFFNPKFNVDSWHARLHCYVYDEPRGFHTGWGRISICRYFWSTLLAAFLFPFALSGKKFMENTTYESRKQMKHTATGVFAGVSTAIVIGATSIAIYLVYVTSPTAEACGLPLKV